MVGAPKKLTQVKIKLIKFEKLNSCNINLRMKIEIINPKETIDLVLRKACLVVLLASFPAYANFIYRNLYL